MKSKIIKRISLILIVFIMAMILTGCSGPIYTSGAVWIGFDWERDKNINAKIESDNLFFDINDVTLDYFYTFYSLENNESLDELKEDFYFDNRCNSFSPDSRAWQYVHAIYISKNKNLTFEMYEDNLTVIDYEKKVNAQLVKFIGYEEAFDINYGFTTVKTGGEFSKTIKYNHGEKITIPAELFDSSSNYVYIHLVRLNHNLINDKYEYYNFREYTVDIEYRLLGDNTVILIN